MKAASALLLVLFLSACGSGGDGQCIFVTDKDPRAGTPPYCPAQKSADHE